MADPTYTALAKATPLRHRHAWNAAVSYDEAFDGDPLFHYTIDTPDYKNSLVDKIVWRLLVFITFFLSPKVDVPFTVCGGTTVIVGVYPRHRRTPIGRLFSRLNEVKLGAKVRARTPQQRERRDEISEKMQAVLENKLGERVKEMVWIGILYTAPKEQRKGFGSAAMGAITNLTDKQGRATWLLSSNTVNDELYASHGFNTIDSFFIGDKNPHWHEKPILIKIMVREVQTLYKCTP